jgi:hypothetical protein
MNGKGKTFIWLVLGMIVLTVVLILNEEKRRVSQPAYTIAAVVGIGTNGRSGAGYVNYKFNVNGASYTGWVPKEDCPACKVGALVRIRYENGNPENSELIK